MSKWRNEILHNPARLSGDDLFRANGDYVPRDLVEALEADRDAWKQLAVWAAADLLGGLRNYPAAWYVRYDALKNKEEA